MIISVIRMYYMIKRTYFQKGNTYTYIQTYICIYIYCRHYIFMYIYTHIYILVSIYTHTFLFVYWEGKGKYITSIVYKSEDILKESVFSFYLVRPGNSIQGFRLEMGYFTLWGISLVSFSSLIHFEWVLCKT